MGNTQRHIGGNQHADTVSCNFYRAGVVLRKDKSVLYILESTKYSGILPPMGRGGNQQLGSFSIHVEQGCCF